MRLRTAGCGLAIALAALLAGCGGPDTATPPAIEVSRGQRWHENVVTTVFWVGEKGNTSSAWCGDWVAAYGGVDDPQKRSGFHPSGFTPRENPFYCALPCNRSLYKQAKVSALDKDRWIEIEFKGRRCFAQWEDVGPYHTDDYGYVFGGKPPKAKVGLDVSPAVRDYLDLSGNDATRWRFVKAEAVPPGPWKEIVTASGPSGR